MGILISEIGQHKTGRKHFWSFLLPTFMMNHGSLVSHFSHGTRRQEAFSGISKNRRKKKGQGGWAEDVSSKNETL